MVIAFIITIALFVFIYETINISILQKKTVNFKINRSDITKPKFTINSENQKISISANEGNFRVIFLFPCHYFLSFDSYFANEFESTISRVLTFAIDEKNREIAKSYKQSKKTKLIKNVS